MATNSDSTPESPALEGLRHRGQALISGLLWAAAAGLFVVLSGYALILYHYVIALAERVRSSLGFAAPPHSPDWFMIAALSSAPLLCVFCVALLGVWYRHLWLRKLRGVWPDARDRRRYGRWRPLPLHAGVAHRTYRAEHLTALLKSDLWATGDHPS